ncbi:MAG: Iron siderophore sensor protein [Myxococcaceae bacterium]|nr:Iron siderophore sensor protein [Myxococcaceae bacterium]
MSEPTKFAEFVMPELNKSRLDAQWARMRSSLEGRPAERKRQSSTLPAVGILVAACALGVLWWPRDSRGGVESSVWEGSVVASDDAPVEMTLAEGTLIQVDPRSEVKLLHSSAQAVQVRLAHGSARFKVAKKRSRRFSVTLGTVEVGVTGTQFRVLRKAGPGGERVQVQVEEGSVEVHRGDGGVVALHAGDHWSTVFPNTPATSEAKTTLEADSPAPSETFELPAVNQEEVREGDVDTAGEPEESSESSVDGEDNDADEDRDVDSARTDSHRESAHARRAASRRRAMRGARGSVADAGELFDHANLARRAGRLEDAAELYADVVGRYPRDRRASLAAFELGRLRMDSLRDVRGAVAALERALKLDGRGAFAEDALARLVLAEEALGDRSGCSRARARYLARYPEGVHAQHVAERCGGN